MTCRIEVGELGVRQGMEPPVPSRADIHPMPVSRIPYSSSWIYCELYVFFFIVHIHPPQVPVEAALAWSPSRMRTSTLWASSSKNPWTASALTRASSFSGRLEGFSADHT